MGFGRFGAYHGCMPSRVLSFARLLRLPNVFTAFADIALAGCATGFIVEEPLTILLLCLASGSLYLAGMVWNDVFDRREDAISQAFRPIPSGQVRTSTAVVLGIGLFILGGWLAALTYDPRGSMEGWLAPPFVAGLLMLAILLYDGGLKRTPLGPVAMGLCRALNVLLGLSASPSSLTNETLWLLPAVTGTYIIGVTWFARTEEAESNRRQLIWASGVMALALALALVLRSRLPADSGTMLFPYLLVGFGFFVGLPLARAVQNPGPKQVQTAIKRCVLGLVALDAVLATAFVGLPGLAILLLLPPALLLGKWVYST